MSDYTPNHKIRQSIIGYFEPTWKANQHPARCLMCDASIPTGQGWKYHDTTGDHILCGTCNQAELARRGMGDDCTCVLPEQQCAACRAAAIISDESELPF